MTLMINGAALLLWRPAPAGRTAAWAARTWAPIGRTAARVTVWSLGRAA